MSTKSKLITGYFAVALVYAIYLTNWGSSAYRGFTYNLGAAIFWPVTMFPGLGKVIGGFIMVAVVALVVLFSRGNSK